MNTVQASDLSHTGEREEQALKVTAGASITEAIGGIGALVLAIIGLANVFPRIVGSVGIIAVGGALFIEGGAIGSRYLGRLRGISGGRLPAQDLGLGMTAEFFAGAAGVVLGILALIGVGTVELMAPAIIAFGAALLLGNGLTARINRTTDRFSATPPEAGSPLAQVMNELTLAAGGGQVLLGMAAVVLGILAVCHVSPYTLTMAGLLCAAASVLFTGTTIGTKMVGLLYER